MGEENGLCTVQISVTDTGIGISAEQQARLFQSFQQAESSTVRKYGGTGLGLSISRSIVEMMGGKISVRSEPDKGSVFTFTIQVKRGEEKKQRLQDRTLNWGEVRILAVDDDPDILEFFRDIAQRYKVSCDTAPGGEEALQLIQQNGDYNIYFVDWKMPGIDGIALTNTIRMVERNPGTAIVIMISAVEWSDIKEEAKKAGVDLFLAKPLFPSAVADAINECLGLDRQQAKSVPQNDNGVFTGRRVLLVEDVEINREIVLTLLESTELEIDCAENGIQAVRMFSDNPDKYEIIFMDVQMPEMDGYEATRRIRAIEAELRSVSTSTSNKGDLRKQILNPGTSFTKGETRSYNGDLRKQIPIIAMTANVFKEDIEKCLEAGMDDHIGKPLDFDIVLDKLRAYLSGASCFHA
jgi:CheY-like chemotaxis protein